MNNRKSSTVSVIPSPQIFFQNGVREEIVNGLDGHKQKTMSTTIYFKGGFPSEILFDEGISKLNYEGINFGKLKIDSKSHL